MTYSRFSIQCACTLWLSLNHLSKELSRLEFSRAGKKEIQFMGVLMINLRTLLK